MTAISPAQRERARRLEKELADRGLIIAGGWAGFRVMCISDNAPQIQIEEMRSAFFAGAQHLFSSIMSILDPGEDPTAADLKRMDLINKELQTFLAQFERKHGLAGRTQ
jgi:hypothetical protein